MIRSLSPGVGTRTGAGMRRNTVIDYVDNTAAPPTENAGEWYLLDDTGVSHANWDGVPALSFARFDGLVWRATAPVEGMRVYVDAEDAERVYVDDPAPAWEKRVYSRPTTDNKNKAGLLTTGDGDQACGVAIQATPVADGYVRVLVNGQATTLGDGDKAHDCYFSGDGGSTARSIADVASGDVLYWNGSVAGYQLATTDRLSFDYNEPV